MFQHALDRTLAALGLHEKKQDSLTGVNLYNHEKGILRKSDTPINHLSQIEIQ